MQQRNENTAELVVLHGYPTQKGGHFFPPLLLGRSEIAGVLSCS